MTVIRSIKVRMRHLKSLSHFKGYAVHSPFVFGLTEYVFPANLHFYGHETISNEWYTKILSNQDKPFSSLKNALYVHKYLVKLKPKTILILGIETDFIRSIISSASQSIDISTSKTSKIELLPSTTYDGIIIVNLESLSNTHIKQIPKLINPNGFILADAIHQSPETFEAWHKLLLLKTRSVSVATFNLGFISTNFELPKQDFSIFI